MTEGTESLSQDDMKDLAAALHRYADVSERQLASASVPSSNRNTNRTEIHRDGNAVWVAVTACLLALVVAWNAQQRVTDLRIDMQAERLSREQMDNWTAQEVTAIRSYITNGKLVPMQPRPTPKKEAKNVP